LAVTRWLAYYEKGEPFADREWLDPVDMQAKPVTVKYCHHVMFRPGGLEHLVRILVALKPDWSVTQDFLKVQDIMQRASIEERRRLLNYKLGMHGIYTIDLAFYKQEVFDLREALLEAKSGKKADLAATVAAQKEQGKAPFEL
jgi:hypothetical protein